MKVYSRFKPNCTAILMGTVDSKGNQPALISDPDIDEGEPFNTVTKPAEWSRVPLVPAPLGMPEVFKMNVWQSPGGEIWLDVADEHDEGIIMDTLVGSFVVKTPSLLVSPLD